MNINSFVPLESVFSNGIISSESETQSTEDSFQSVLQENLDKLNEQQISADEITNEFVSGGDVEIHEMMLSMEEAKMSLQLAIQIRNKVVDAVKELTNMQL